MGGKIEEPRPKYMSDNTIADLLAVQAPAISKPSVSRDLPASLRELGSIDDIIRPLRVAAYCPGPERADGRMRSRVRCNIVLHSIDH